MSDHDEPTRGRHADDAGPTKIDTDDLSGAYVLNALSDDERLAFEEFQSRDEDVVKVGIPLECLGRQSTLWVVQRIDQNRR